jgi:hypothetical protein
MMDVTGGVSIPLPNFIAMAARQHRIQLSAHVTFNANFAEGLPTARRADLRRVKFINRDYNNSTTLFLLLKE